MAKNKKPKSISPALKQFNTQDAQRVVQKLEELCQQALVEDCHLDAAAATARLQAELDYYRNLRLEEKTIEEVYQRFCMSLANRDRLWNLIFGRSWEDLDRAYGELLRNYNPR